MKRISLLLFTFVFVATNAQIPMSKKTNASTSGILTVTTTTNSNGGSYAPDHIVAIWIEDNFGDYVKTMLANADRRKVYLTNYISKSADNRVDAISGATSSSHGMITANWNATNVSKVVVADGDYKVRMELTDDNGTGSEATYVFTKGTTVSTGTLSGTASACFTNVSIQWTPTVTGIDEVKLSNLYSVYPNPFKSTIYVNGVDVQQVEILTLTGKSILKTNLQNVNLSVLPTGLYLVQITTPKGSFIKKIIKE